MSDFLTPGDPLGEALLAEGRSVGALPKPRSCGPEERLSFTRLADILVIQAFRSWIAQDPSAQTGWLGALQDNPQLTQGSVYALRTNNAETATPARTMQF